MGPTEHVDDVELDELLVVAFALFEGDTLADVVIVEKDDVIVALALELEEPEKLEDDELEIVPELDDVSEERLELDKLELAAELELLEKVELTVGEDEMELETLEELPRVGLTGVEEVVDPTGVEIEEETLITVDELLPRVGPTEVDDDVFTAVDLDFEVFVW